MKEFCLVCFKILLFSVVYVSPACCLKAHDHHCAPADASLLLQFKNHFNIVESASEWCDGSQAIKKLRWDEGSDCCKWEGVSCDLSTGHVIGLDLSCVGLEGSIHPNSTLFQLHHLQTLNLAFNYFSSGSLPGAIGSLTALTHLNISHSYLSGTIRSEISQLSKLVSLDLSRNFDDNNGNSSSLSFLQNLTKLELLSLYDTGLSSTIPTNISSLLRYLDLSWNNIVGSIPDTIFQLPQLQSIILFENSELVGSLPKLSWNCNRTLQELYLGLTNISGELPESIANLRSLKYFIVGWSSFFGFIPESIGNLTHLEILDLSQNEFSGSVPSSIVNLSQLEDLDLAGNSLIGPLPSISTGLQKLSSLYLSRNALNGTIPPWVFSLPSLTWLYLSQNHFSGKLPQISSTSSLKYVDLSNNQIDGLIPRSISNLLKATVLNFASNNFSGNIPPWLFSLPSLLILDLSKNQFTGKLPQVSSKSSLKSVDLSNNQLDGWIPHSVFLNITNLSVLNLQSNQLQGSLTIAVCNSSALEFLILKNNKFNGTIPQCLGELDQLSVLDLGMNNFNSIVPTMFAKGKSLTTILLHGNQLRGPIPTSLVNCTQLEVLDLGNNKLKDTFPEWLGDLMELRVLVLKSNILFGPITSSNSTMWFPKLQIFDLSCNGFTGALPKYFFNGFNSMTINVTLESKKDASYLEVGKSRYYDISIGLMVKGHEIQLERVLTILTAFDLSSNQLQGEIPTLIGNLDSLILLNLSHNCFNGSIPHQIGNLTSLESLDISWNQLAGKIPEQITNLKFLEVLNLSQNHLVGHIPRSNQFNTFENNSYGGNLDLCGFPMSRECNDHNRSPEPQQQHAEQEDDKSDFLSGFTWRSVLIGFCCGAVIGIFIENLMSRTGRPKWFVTFCGTKIRKPVPR